MTREEFVEGYMSRSELLPYTLDGELVTYSQGDYRWVQHALECRCEEAECEGWAMIQVGAQNWHKFQNGLTDMTGEEAMDADIAVMESAEAYEKVWGRKPGAEEWARIASEQDARRVRECHCTGACMVDGKQDLARCPSFAD